MCGPFIYLFRTHFRQVTRERDAARNRTELVGSEVLVVARDLEARRQELDAFRRATFESYVAQHPPPPKYDVALMPPTLDNPPTLRDNPIKQSVNTQVIPAKEDDEVEQFFQNLSKTQAMASPLQMPTPETTTQGSSSAWGSSE
jgi:hypothetical protein